MLQFEQDGVQTMQHSNTEQDRYHHPIDHKHMRVPNHEPITEADVHELLEEINEYVTVDQLEDIDGATPYDALAESETNVAAHTTYAVWEEIFAEVGITSDLDKDGVTEEYAEHARATVVTAHELHGVNELDMDHNQPTYILVASKDQ
jgi:hypothetical protein